MRAACALSIKRSSFQRPASRISCSSVWRRGLTFPYMSVSSADDQTGRFRSGRRVAASDVWQQVLAEGPAQIVRRLKAPVSTCARIVDILGPRIHDGLSPAIRRERDLLGRK